MSETLTEASSTSSPQTAGAPTRCSLQPLLPYCLAVTTMRLVLPCHAKLLLWCQDSCTDIILLHFPPQISLSVRISGHPQRYFTCLPPFLLEMFCLRVKFQSCGMLPPAAKPTQWPNYFFMLFGNVPTLKIYGIGNTFTSACHIKLLP